MAEVLLTGKDWTERALLRAQLLEEGIAAEAYLTVRDALRSLEEAEFLPALLIADLGASDDPGEEVELLTSWAKQIPIWIIASRSTIVARRLRGRGFDMILFRPVDVGELVEQIKRRIGHSRASENPRT
jgi:DNA-binding response OmpR family regulator